MRRPLPGRLLVAVALVLATSCAGAPDRSPLLLTWFDQTSAAVRAQGPLPDPVAARTWALAWWAADRAAAGRPAGAVTDALVATAVHDVLVVLAPSRRRALDRALREVPGRGAAAADGHRAAASVLAERADDGLSLAEVERPRPAPPAPSAGTWRPVSPDVPPAEPRLADATPFLLRGSAQLRPGPPPRPGSAAYRRDLAEVRAVGADRSSVRTPAQTDLARFWGGSELALQVGLLRAALVAGRVETLRGVRLLSAYHRITADAEVAAFDAKYAYLAWRPVSAVRLDDADPATPTEADWTPLLATPGHPEYPSAHTVYAAAGAAVLEHFLGAAPAAALELQSPDLPGTTRTYATWQQSVLENEDARVYAGVHVRTSDRVGSELGRAVAAYGLAQLSPGR